MPIKILLTATQVGVGICAIRYLVYNIFQSLNIMMNALAEMCSVAGSELNRVASTIATDYA